MTSRELCPPAPFAVRKATRGRWVEAGLCRCRSHLFCVSGQVVCGGAGFFGGCRQALHVVKACVWRRA